MDAAKETKMTNPPGADAKISPSGDVPMDAATEAKTTNPPGADAKLPLPGLLPAKPSGIIPTNQGQPLPPHSVAGDPAGVKIPKSLRGISERNTVATRPQQDPDRHCYRASRNGCMKCEACWDYNKGVAARCCQVCGHNNSIFQR